jgi:hypothetical protein
VTCGILRISSHYCLFFRDKYPEVQICGSGSSVNGINTTRNLTLNYVTGNKLCNEVMWHTVEDLKVPDSDVKLNRENSKDLTNAYVVAGSSAGYSCNFSSPSYESDNLEGLFPFEKFSKYTGELIKCYVSSSSSPEHSSFGDEHKCEFNNNVSEVELVSRTSPSEVLTRPRPIEKHNVRNHYSSAKSKEGTKCHSDLSDDHSDRESSRSRYEEKLSLGKLRQKSIHPVVSEEKDTSGCSWEKESDVPDILKAVIKNTIGCQGDPTSDGRKVEETVTDSGSKNVEPTTGNYSSNKEHKIFTLETDVMEVASSKKSGTVKKKSSKLQKCGSNSTIKHYFKMKNPEHFSSSSDSEQSVRTPDVSNSDDSVPGTSVHTTQFGIQYMNRTEMSPVVSPSSLSHCLIDPKSSARIQMAKSGLVDCGTDKSSHKTEVPLGHCSKHTKQGKSNRLSTKRKRYKSSLEVSKNVNASILSYFGSPVQTVKYSVRKYDITDNAVCGTDNEKNSQQKHSPCHSNYFPMRQDAGNWGEGSSLQIPFQQQLETTVNATNEDDIHNNHMCNSFRRELKEVIELSEGPLCDTGQHELNIVPDVSINDSDNLETNNRQEVTTSTDNFETRCKEQEEAISSQNEEQDFKVVHLTLEQLEQRFKNNVEYLRDILMGKKYCWRHEQFKKGGTALHSLHYAVAVVPYTNKQLDHLLLLLRKTFFHEHNYVTYFNYIVKVLLPEATAKIFMDEFSLDHQEALNKIHEVYIASDTADDMFDMVLFDNS